MVLFPLPRHGPFVALFLPLVETVRLDRADAPIGSPPLFFWSVSTPLSLREREPGMFYHCYLVAGYALPLFSSSAPFRKVVPLFQLAASWGDSLLLGHCAPILSFLARAFLVILP